MCRRARRHAEPPLRRGSSGLRTDSPPSLACVYAELQWTLTLRCLPAPESSSFTRFASSMPIESSICLRNACGSGSVAAGLADAQRALGEVTGWIAQRSPAELAAPACFSEKGATLRDRFLTVPSPGCHPLARPNCGLLQQGAPAVGAAGRHHQADRALLRHGEQTVTRTHHRLRAAAPIAP